MVAYCDVMSTNSFVCLTKRTLNDIACFRNLPPEKPLWRNGLACWTSNSKVVGSSPTRGGFFFLFFNLYHFKAVS